MIDKVEWARIANDNCFYLISMFKSLQNGWKPPTNLTKEEYFLIKQNKEKYPPELVAFVGYCCSFGGKWFGGYVSEEINNGLNRANQGYNNLTKQIVNLNTVEFYNEDYQDLKIPNRSIIYCDPPYQKTTKYKTEFNHEEFWNWCRIKTKEGNSLFISEYQAPDDFKCVFEQKTITELNKSKKDKRTEKLFTYDINR